MTGQGQHKSHRPFCLWARHRISGAVSSRLSRDGEGDSILILVVKVTLPWSLEGYTVKFSLTWPKLGLLQISLHPLTSYSLFSVFVISLLGAL